MGPFPFDIPFGGKTVEEVFLQSQPRQNNFLHLADEKCHHTHAHDDQPSCFADGMDVQNSGKNRCKDKDKDQ
jgi:hypothetical protein